MQVDHASLLVRSSLIPDLLALVASPGLAHLGDQRGRRGARRADALPLPRGAGRERARVGALEERLGRISLAAESASGNAARAEVIDTATWDRAAANCELVYRKMLDQCHQPQASEPPRLSQLQHRMRRSDELTPAP